MRLFDAYKFLANIMCVYLDNCHYGWAFLKVPAIVSQDLRKMKHLTSIYN